MNTTTKRATRRLAALLAIITSLATSSAWANVLWYYAGISRTLTIRGSGAMTDYSDSSETPWKGNLNSILYIVVEEGVTSIGKCAFKDCNRLRSVVLPSTLTNIGPSAFENCADPCFNSVTIPASVRSIGYNAFNNCSFLETVTVYAPACILDLRVFDSCNALKNIYVFSDLVDSYRGMFRWGVYSSIISDIKVPAKEGASGVYWATYYNDLANAKVPEVTQVFKVHLDGTKLEMTEIENRIISKGEGVVLKSSCATIPLDSVAQASATTYDGNSLKGTRTSITNPGNAYVLNNTGSNGLGFYKLDASGTIGANEAYLTYDGSGDFLGFAGSATGHAAWAEENSITGAWNETDENGIHNVFRYVFDVPSGAFDKTPLIDIAFEDGKVVVKTPPVVNSDGVTVSVVESSDVAGKTVTATKAIDAAGSTEFTKDSTAASRFYRLKAEVTE